MIRAAFLDRDGVLNVRPAPQQYVTNVDDLQVIPGAGAAVALLREAGYTPIVVSNQRGVARGLMTENTLRQIELRLRREGVDVDIFYYCLHDWTDYCDCRKPRPGLLWQAKWDWGISLRRSVMIGDDAVDVAAGRSAGVYTIRIGQDVLMPSQANVNAPNLLSAVLRACERQPDAVAA